MPRVSSLCRLLSPVRPFGVPSLSHPSFIYYSPSSFHLHVLAHTKGTFTFKTQTEKKSCGSVGSTLVSSFCAHALKIKTKKPASSEDERSIKRPTPLVRAPLIFPMINDGLRKRGLGKMLMAWVLGGTGHQRTLPRCLLWGIFIYFLFRRRRGRWGAGASVSYCYQG